MRIVTTPMCEEILKLSGVADYSVNKFPTEEDGDLAILLSESKTDMDCIYLKLNTFSQIQESLNRVTERLDKPKVFLSFDECPLANRYLENTPENRTRVKVYSNFLKDIAMDMGFEINGEYYDYVVVPDYLLDEINEKTVPIIEIPSHGAVSLNPIERACMRYKILEDYINK